MSEEKQEFELNIIGWHCVFLGSTPVAAFKSDNDAFTYRKNLDFIYNNLWYTDLQRIERKVDFPDDLKRDVENFLRELRANYDHAPYLDGLLERMESE